MPGPKVRRRRKAPVREGSSSSSKRRVGLGRRPGGRGLSTGGRATGRPLSRIPGWATTRGPSDREGRFETGEILGPAKMLMPTRFRPEVRLDPSRVQDLRGVPNASTVSPLDVAKELARRAGFFGGRNLGWQPEPVRSTQTSRRRANTNYSSTSSSSKAATTMKKIIKGKKRNTRNR